MKISRVTKILSQMEESKIPQLIITSAESIFYLTGKMIHSGERLVALYLDVNGNHKFLVNKLFPINEDLGVEIVWYDDIENPIDRLEIVKQGEVLGVDKDLPSHFLIDLMGRNVIKAFVNSSPIIDRLRMIKDEEEIKIMKEASKINDAVMLKLWSNLKEGYSEKYYANLLAEIYEEEGASGFSFSPIIATSPNGADPHHGTGKDKIKVGDSVVLDIGGRYKNYCSDMTRTVFIGKEPSKEHAHVYNIVKSANEKAISIIKEGVKFSDIDKAARNLITEAGYGEYFTHRTGHSIGIEVHDFGNVSSVNDDEVKAGMIFSVEPGIYLKDNIGEKGENYINWAHDNGYKVWPMISNAEAAKSSLSITSKIMNSYESRQKLIESIVNKCVKYNLDGVNIDFENMREDDKDMYSRFIIELTPRLKEIGLVTSVDATAPDGGETWSLCFDRNVIGNVADYIVFMAYDEYGTSSTKPGTTAGYDWVKLNLEKFLKTEEIKSEKIILAVPFYTRVWTTNSGGKIISRNTVAMKDIEKVLPNDVEKKWDNDLKQNYAEYKDGDNKKEIWIEDIQSLKEKVSLIKEKNLAGVGSWQKDMEDDAVWSMLKNELK